MEAVENGAGMTAIAQPDAWAERERAVLHQAVDEFAAAMKAKLDAKVAAGVAGWCDAGNAHALWLALLSAALKTRAQGQEVDVANFALFLWWIQSRGR